MLTRRYFIKNIIGAGLLCSAGPVFAATDLFQKPVETLMLEGLAKNLVDLSIVDIKNIYPWQSCFIGTGISGRKIAKRLLEEYYFIGNHNSTTVLNVTNQSGESLELMKQTLPHLEDQALVIISGSINDPAFLTLRDMTLSSSPKSLWTILESQRNIIERTSLIQPQMNESITVIPPGTDYIKRSLVLVQTLNHYLHESATVSMACWDDVMTTFAGHWTKIIDVETNDQRYRKDIQLFILHNIAHLPHSRSARVIIFAGPFFANSVLDRIMELFCDNRIQISIMSLSVYIVDDFYSKLHVAIIMDDKFIMPENGSIPT
jgi:hypothetical protein